MRSLKILGIGWGKGPLPLEAASLEYFDLKLFITENGIN